MLLGFFWLGKIRREHCLFFSVVFCLFGCGLGWVGLGCSMLCKPLEGEGLNLKDTIRWKGNCVEGRDIIVSYPAKVKY